MTKTEILEKIDKGVRGQGNQVDIGNVLADVLTEIVDGGPTLTVTKADAGGALTKEEFAANLGITETEVDNLFRGDYKSVRYKIVEENFVCICNMPLIYSDSAVEEPDFYKQFTFGDMSVDFGRQFCFALDDSGYHISYNET